ncbi:site-specific integrase [Priestia sp. 179-F W1.4 NHS]|uniref:site-specific integrase n=1 Tax=Priestia sp. 179-F W1.4 NHS TaxID=3374296 RepID=UPI0038798374
MRKLINYRFKVKETEVLEDYNGMLKPSRVITIVIEDENTGIEIPHPLTDFIKLYFENNGVSLNTQKAPARVMCNFLNFIYTQIDEGNSDFINLRYEGIKGINLIHGSKYLSYLTAKNLKRKTVKYHDFYLTKFYKFLKDQSLLKESIEIKELNNNYGRETTESIFNKASLGTVYPSRRKSGTHNYKIKDFGENRYLLVSEFLEEVKQIAPEIAFGVALQFFGGLRRGEVVNLSRADLKVKYRQSLHVHIRDNRELLFSRLRDTSKEYAKRLNYLGLHLTQQVILDNDFLWDLYDNHMKDLDIKIRDRRIKTSALIFYDRDGYPMSGTVYERRFNKVKRVFLNKLKNTKGRYEDYEHLSSGSWGTHIGRGIFTNFLIDMNLSLLQIAIARGDRNVDSALAYIDEKMTKKTLRHVIDELHKTEDERLGNIERTIINNRWKGEGMSGRSRYRY